MDNVNDSVLDEPWTHISCTISSKAGRTITVYFGSRGGFSKNALKHVPKGPATAQLDISDPTDPKIIVRPILQS